MRGQPERADRSGAGGRPESIGNSVRRGLHLEPPIGAVPAIWSLLDQFAATWLSGAPEPRKDRRRAITTAANGKRRQPDQAQAQSPRGRRQNLSQLASEDFLVSAEYSVKTLR